MEGEEQGSAGRMEVDEGDMDDHGDGMGVGGSGSSMVMEQGYYSDDVKAGMEGEGMAEGEVEGTSDGVETQHMLTADDFEDDSNLSKVLELEQYPMGTLSVQGYIRNFGDRFDDEQ